MREREATAYYALQDADGTLLVCHAKVGKAPDGAKPISEEEAAAIKAMRTAPAMPEAAPPVAVPSTAIHAELDAIRAEIEGIKQAISPEMRGDIARLKEDVAQIIGGLKQIYHENKAVIEGKK